MLLRRQEVVSVVDLINVQLAKLLHVAEHLVGKADTFARILERLAVVLVLGENGAKLQLELALLVHAPVPHRDSLALVEFGIANERNRLLQVEDALFKHANPEKNDTL